MWTLISTERFLNTQYNFIDSIHQQNLQLPCVNAFAICKIIDAIMQLV